MYCVMKNFLSPVEVLMNHEFFSHVHNYVTANPLTCECAVYFFYKKTYKVYRGIVSSQPIECFLRFHDDGSRRWLIREIKRASQLPSGSVQSFCYPESANVLNVLDI